MRKRNGILKKGIAIVLESVLIAGTIAGCGKNKTEDNSLINQAALASKDYVFKAERIDSLPEGDYNSLKVVGDRVYTATYGNNGFFDVYSFNLDGSDVQSLRFSQKDNETYGSWSYDTEGNMYCIHYVYDWSDMEDGDVILYETEDGETASITETEAPATEDASSEEAPSEDVTEAETEDADSKKVVDTDPEAPSEGEEPEGDFAETDGDKRYLKKFDKTGKEVFSIDLAEYSSPDEDDYYVYSMLYTKDYGILISSTHGIETLDENSLTIQTLVDTTDNSSEFYDRNINIYEGSGGKYFVSSWGDKGIEFRSFDPATKKFGEISNAFKSYNEYSFFPGEGYDIYVSQNDGFYGYDAASDTEVKLLDYMDSDLGISFSTSSAVAISPEEFIANIPDEEYNYTLYRLTKIPADQVKDKKVITIAGSYINYDVRRKASTFNQENDEYRIKLIDYSSLDSDEDWNAGKTQMNLDIVSGNTPDIMIFDSQDSLNSYINKGLFADLNPFIQNDPVLKDEKFVDNVISAFTVDGKLYQLPESFYIESVATKTKYLEGKDNLTIKDCTDIIERAGVDYAMSFGLAQKELMLTNGLASAGRNYIDWEKKSCNFDSDEFIEFLEFVNKFPDEIKDSLWDSYKQTCYRDGTAVFSYAYIYSFRSYKRLEAGEFGEPITMVGYPNNLGVNCSMICANDRFTISSQSKNAEGAWQFVRQFFLPEAQDKIENNFPILQSSFDKMGEKSLEREYYLDENGKKQYQDDTYYLGDTEIVIDPLTKDELEKVKNFIYSVENVADYNTSVYNIINEEVSAYFSGQKTAKEVAQIIQSRVSIYVNENS
ncbi:ABC transporter substrate-binding protein [Butyrivibrio sp. FCS014]|uniref:ABC transporter substrate-binding protein n=1 Tax=Butyrivibrio sp. FCS014 TaxID=1408304 RepID=UPI000466CD28|nr:ABC transporter substrate-binding protein [Butyrivibrio sp. FCS014]